MSVRAIANQLGLAPYFGNVTQTEAASGAITETTNDALGRLVSQRRHPESGYSLANSFETTYAYDVDDGDGFDGAYPAAAGEGFSLVTVTDPDLKETAFVSNLAGQRLILDDPNAGVSTYEYDLNGQATSVESEAGTLSMDYDALGRMVARTSLMPDDTTVSSSATWTFENGFEQAAPTGALKVTTATTVMPGFGDFTTTQTTDSWDGLGRPTQTTMTLPDVDELGQELKGYGYVRKMTYDEVSRPTVTLPAVTGTLHEQTPITRYNRFGTAVALDVINTPGVSQSVTPLVTGVELDSLGRLTTRTYANTVERKIAYDALWGAPQRIAAVYDNGAGDVAIQDDYFVRDDVSRVTEIVDAASVQGETQCFVYDEYNRLSNAWTIETTSGTPEACSTASTANVPVAGDTFFLEAAGPYATTWEYSKAGRIESITNLIADATEDSIAQVDDFLSYGQGNAGPAAVTGIDTDGDETADGTFTYDAAGRQITRSVDGKDTDLTWDVSSNLVKAVVDEGTANETVWLYVYDASGQRVAKIQLADANQDDDFENVDATVYFGDTELTDATTADNVMGDLTAVRFFTIGGATVAGVQGQEAVSPSPTWFYLLGDYQGSAQVMMTAEADPATATITRNAYTPYGAKRDYDANNDTTPDPTLDLERGWLSQVADEDPSTGGTGLTYLNARYYDPASARFISPDPLLDVMDPKTLDPYRYADNNPIVYTDATGLAPCSGAGAGEAACLEAYRKGLRMSEGDPGKKSAAAPKPTAQSLVPTLQLEEDPNGTTEVWTERKTAKEVELMGYNLWNWTHMSQIKDRGDEYGEEYYCFSWKRRKGACAGREDGHIDAMRHAMGAIQLADWRGSDFALEFMTAHEGVANNPANREAMDLWNNAVGVKIYRENPGKTLDEYAALVDDAMKRGDLMVIGGDGNAYWSNEVPVGGTGETSPDTLEPGVSHDDMISRLGQV